ncbi:MAG: hypothetical protein KF914_14135 [Rhizobiaceae bacterium]|nr:hypothetical protein [Rhizobiaceae bacterium]
MTTALFAAAFDSQLKWSAGLRAEFESRGVACRIVVPDVRSALSDAQIADAGVDRVERVAWKEMMAFAMLSDVFVSALSGPSTKRISIELHRMGETLGRRPPVLVAGWVGIIIEKLVAGYLDRCACDVVAVNSRADLERFESAARHLSLPTGNLLLSGMPFLPSELAPLRGGPIRTVLYADQPTVPDTAWDRLYAYRRLIGYARAHPERTVLLKPRHRLGESTFHKMLFHPEDLLRGEVLPANFRIDYTPVADLLPEVDLLLTFSSTAALEAIAAGCRAAAVLDLGVHEKFGNPVFLESGLLRTFDQIGADEIGEPERGWIDAFFPRLGRSAAAVIVDSALTALSRDLRAADAVRATPYFRGMVESHEATVQIRDSLKPMLRRSKSKGLQARRAGYDPVRRAVYTIGDALLPGAIARPVDRLLRRLKLL